MCGIIGSKNVNTLFNRKLALSYLNKRGPDSSDEYFDKDENLWIGHTRLSIQDLSERASQPMSSDKYDSYVISFNGEIYNSLDLKEELVNLGSSFKTRSDTEVILEGFKEWGLDIFHKLEGMFALVIWDKNKKELILARDSVGQKPLYYYISPKDQIYFASNLKSLLEILPFKPSISKNAFAYSLCLGYVPNCQTVYEDIKSLEQGHFLVFSKNNSSIKQFWNIKNISFNNENFESKGQVFENLFDKVCKEHLLSDVPIGILLSGGLDSSTIAYFTKGSEDLTAYSLSFENIDDADSIVAADTAKLLGLDFVPIVIKNCNIDKLMHEVSINQVQPQGYSSFITWYLVSSYISKSAKVVLSGDGGDEVFGGYSWYKRLNKKEKLFNFLRAIRNKVDYQFYKLSLKSSLHKHWILQFPRFLPEEACKLLQIEKDEFNDEIIIENFKKFFQPELPLIDALKRVDLMTFCSDHICRKTDEMSMAHSLEVRAPFLDRRIIEFGMSHKTKEYSALESKYILREFLKREIPNETYKLPKKGFSMRFDKYNYNNLIYEIKNSDIISDGIINKNFMEIIEKPTIFKKSRIYTLGNLARWYHYHKVL